MAKTKYPASGYLVVEGFIDAGGGTTHITLSRTTPLDQSNYLPQSGAAVNIQSESGQVYELTDQGTGVYTADGIPVQASDRYRLHIVLNGVSEYLSDYTKVHITPPVDSVTWKERNNGLQVYLNSHDATGGSQFYKWTYGETWKYTAKYYSSLIWDPSAKFHFSTRPEDQLLYTCWKSDVSTGILLASTAKLSSDVLSQQPVTFIPYSEPSSKLILRYSINVSLEVLAADEYQWFDKLRKNTENLGSIFDAQPSELGGNIHSVTDPTETVIGWVGCHSVTSQRIFIGRADIPSQPVLDDGYSNCMPDTVFFVKDSSKLMTAFPPGGYELPITFYTEKGAFEPSGVVGGSIGCADCREKGGVLMRPDFWQD